MDGMASSIFAGEKVFMHKRTFSNPNYTVVSICVTGEQEQAAREFCEQHASAGVEFDGFGMYTSRMPSMLRSVIKMFRGNGKGGTFCSKYVATVMQHIGVPNFESVEPSATSPSSLHRLITTGTKNDDEEQVLASVNAIKPQGVMAPPPYRTGLLSSRGVLPWQS